MEDWIFRYSPIILIVIMFIIQYKIFVRPEDLEKLYTKVLEGMTQNYVPYMIYRDNYNNIQDRLDSIQKDIRDMRNFLLDLKVNGGNV